MAILLVGAAGATEPEDALTQARKIDAECARIHDEGRAAIETGSLAKAVESFAALVVCRDRSPYLVRSAAELNLEDGGVHEAGYDFMRRSEARLRDTAVAWKAFAEWLAGGAFDETLRSAGPGDVAARRIEFSERVAEHGSDLFERQSWDESASAYRFARLARLDATAEAWDDAVGRLAFNQAMAELNARRVETARALLEEIRRRLPDYRPGEVAGALANLDRAGALLEFEALERSAHEAFEAADWPAAAERFEKAAMFLLTRGAPERDPKVCSLRHNVALARWNAGRLDEARAMLVRLQRINPRYEPARMAEDLRRLEAQMGGRAP